MEQNSFLFRQTAVLGLSHYDTLHYIISSACARYQTPSPTPPQATLSNKKSVYILLGGNSTEKQVSLLSGTNVWLKLRQSNKYQPTVYFLDHNTQVWPLPYAYALNHTTEEIFHKCLHTPQQTKNQQLMIKSTQEKLNDNSPKESLIPPKQMSFEEFIAHTAKNNAYIFIALHGGIGEDGSIQKQLTKNNIPYNGSSSHCSSLCMDKYATTLAIKKNAHPDIIHLPKKVITEQEISSFDQFTAQNIWQQTTSWSNHNTIIAKPRADGCSSGIVILRNAEDLLKYIKLIKNKHSTIPANTFDDQHNTIEMPCSQQTEILLEPYIKTDHISIKEQKLMHKSVSGWVEFTVGVTEYNNIYHCMPPSITVTTHGILSLEEKFQGGTGINLTPPPETIVSLSQIEHIQHLIKHCANTLNINNYARLDIFYNRITNKMILIEANSLPGLTPSTVLFHQALAENPAIAPKELLESLIKHSWSIHQNKIQHQPQT